MNENDIRKMFAEWVDAFNSGDVERMRSFYTEDAVLYQAPIKKTLVGLDYIVARLKDFSEMSEDSRFTIRDLHVDGDTAILEFNIAGTHTGRFLDFEPTGRRLDIDSCLIFEVRDGRITKHTTYLDIATVLRALGLISVPGTREEAA